MTDVGAWRARLGPLGVWCTTDPLVATDAAARAQRVETLGYGALPLKPDHPLRVDESALRALAPALR